MNKVDQFNAKYSININKNSFKFVSQKEMKLKEKRALSGKPKKIWKDILKRYFSNKFNLIFTIILLIFLSMIFIVPSVSRYNASDHVSDATEESIRLIKPSWVKDWNHVNKVFSINDYWNFYNNSGVGPFDKPDIITVKDVIDSSGSVSGKEVFYINNHLPKTILGTDSIGRDVWTRLFKGAQWSLGLASIVAVTETILGTALGIYIGFHIGSKIDTLSMRFVEIFRSVPGLLWMLIFSLIIGTSFFAMAGALIFVGWAGPLYTARMFALKIKDAEFIKAAQSIGVSKKGRLFRHILPSIVGRLLVSFVHRIPAVIFVETTLVFLNMKVGGENSLSIGNIISDARTLDVLNNNIAYPTSIACFLLIFMISLQIIANGIRDAFDPKTSGER